MSTSRRTFAKQLRRNMTDAEKLLWYRLRGHRFAGAKFKRQQPLGNYIVDFVCFEFRLVIEVDGGQHLDNSDDLQRDDWLRDQGFEVLRFWNNDVLGQTEAVLEKIYQMITPSPLPLSHEGRGVPGSVYRKEDCLDTLRCDDSLPPCGGGLGRGGRELERIRWRARRGLLELDIVLARFIDAHYPQLNETEKQVFEALLDMPDNPLWDMIAGRQEAARQDQHALLEKIRAA